MERKWIVDISFHGQNESEHLHLSDEMSVGLNYDGLDHGNTSEAMIYIDQDEIVIERVGEVDIEIERGKRRRQLRPSHPTRILPQDKIRMGTREFYINGIQCVERPRRKTSQIGQFANKALLTGAAAMMMIVPACNVKESPKEATEQAVDVQRSEVENAGSESDRLAEEAARAIDEELRVVKADRLEGEVVQIQAKCDNAEEMCLSNNRYSRCDQGNWELIEECKKPATCRKHDVNGLKTTSCENAEPCEDGQYACFGGTVNCEQHPGFGCGVDPEMYKCVNHQWVLQKTCPSGQSCTLQSNTKAECIDYPRVMGKPAIGDDCKGQQQTCHGNAVMFCHWGRWHYKEVCKPEENCKSVSDEKSVCEPITPVPTKN